MTSVTTTAPTLVGKRRVEEVVLPVTFTVADERIIPLAARLALGWRTRLRLVNVSDSTNAPDPRLHALAVELESRYRGLLLVTSHVYGHDVATGIASVVGAHSLVVMATDHADEWAVKGSIAEQVVFSAGVPILLFGPEAKQFNPIGEVVVGLDGSASAETALAAARGLSSSLGTRLWLVQVVPVLQSGDDIDVDIATYIQDQAGMLDDQPVGWEIIHSNDPVTALGSFARARGAAAIVAGARGRTDPHRQTMGSITMGLVSTAHCPVLAVVVTSEETP